MKHLQELSRFSESGKTFFFNKGTSDSGAEYLAVNVLYGKGQQQRVVLFPSHFISFFKHLKGAIEQVGGITINESTRPAPSREPLPTHCPACGASNVAFRVTVEPAAVFCSKCLEWEQVL